ncbi:hypothetical protein GCM10009601_41090 [Streptomyces thermospinosisporus]|uniref:CobW C-terminal domain-containing protein n=1 Tax=Streptomyces thermospinosisporus TaxID=161482 RepID=A0ABN1Z235_9ACTN
MRSRGRFWLADKPDTLFHWDAAGGALCVESAGPWLDSLPDAAWDMVPPVRRAAAALDCPDGPDAGRPPAPCGPHQMNGLERPFSRKGLSSREHKSPLLRLIYSGASGAGAL